MTRAEEGGSGNAATRGAYKFHAWLAAAKALRSASEWRIEPVVCSSPTMNERRPVKMLAADQAGFHDPGWKLENCNAGRGGQRSAGGGVGGGVARRPGAAYGGADGGIGGEAAGGCHHLSEEGRW